MQCDLLQIYSIKIYVYNFNLDMHKSMMTLEYPKQILFDECIAMNCNFLMKASQLSCQPCHLLKRPSSKRAFLQLPTLQLENCARFNTLAAVCTVGLFENPVSDKEGICKSNLHDYMRTVQRPGWS